MAVGKRGPGVTVDKRLSAYIVHIYTLRRVISRVKSGWRYDVEIISAFLAFVNPRITGIGVFCLIDIVNGPDSHKWSGMHKSVTISLLLPAWNMLNQQSSCWWCDVTLMCKVFDKSVHLRHQVEAVPAWTHFFQTLSIFICLSWPVPSLPRGLLWQHTSLVFVWHGKLQAQSWPRVCHSLNKAK